ncbi:AbrB family transcriptional regulator [Paenibacillus sp. 276b]|uniref:AbrB family transcriptional regulator n=1 Tax=Paenibacillus sp. 276b TaxID=1566277 RepID=UPI000AAF8555|nr:AbrB family transcriptional regulator [Paenibacillus sp. 276b]
MNQLPVLLRNEPITVQGSSSVLLIAGSLGLSYILMRMFSLSAATSLLSMAPGGMDQMSIMAHEVNANLSVVSGYQLFRILFIFFIVSSLLKMILMHMLRKKGASTILRSSK